MCSLKSRDRWRKLRIRTGPAQIDNEITRDRKYHGMADLSRNDGEHEVNPRRHTGAGQPFAILDVEPVFTHYCSRSEANEFRKQGMMGGAFVAFKQARTCGQQRTGTDRCQPDARCRLARNRKNAAVPASYGT